jgi:hypothetical protein
MPEEFFQLVSHHLPPEQPVGPKGRRPPIPHRTVVNKVAVGIEGIHAPVTTAKGIY